MAEIDPLNALVPDVADTITKLEDTMRATSRAVTNLETKISKQLSSSQEGATADAPFRDYVREPVNVMRNLQECREEFQKIKSDFAELQKMQVESAANITNEFSKIQTALQLMYESRVLDDQSNVADFMATKGSETVAEQSLQKLKETAEMTHIDSSDTSEQ